MLTTPTSRLPAGSPRSVTAASAIERGSNAVTSAAGRTSLSTCSIWTVALTEIGSSERRVTKPEASRAPLASAPSDPAGGLATASRMMRVATAVTGSCSPLFWSRRPCSV